MCSNAVVAWAVVIGVLHAQCLIQTGRIVGINAYNLLRFTAKGNLYNEIL